MDLSEICRCCKQIKSDMTSIFQSSDSSQLSIPSIENMLKDIGALKFEENPQMPSLICEICLNKLKETYNFKQQIIQTEVELWNILQNKSKDLNDDDISNTSDGTSKDINSQLKSFLSCNKCDEFYAILRSLQVKSVNSEQGIAGILDSKQYNRQKEALKNHMRRHLKPFVCQKCILGFNSAEQLNKHICLKKFTIAINKKLEENKNIVQFTSECRREKTYACNLCDTTCKRLDLIKNHLCSHLKDMPFICTKCNHGFARRQGFKRHVKQCKGDKKFVCETCNRAISTQERLDQHMKAHKTVKTREKSLTLEDLKSNNISKFYTKISEYSDEEITSSDADSDESVQDIVIKEEITEEIDESIQILSDSDEDDYNSNILNDETDLDDNYHLGKRKLTSKSRNSPEKSRHLLKKTKRIKSVIIEKVERIENDSANTVFIKDNVDCAEIEPETTNEAPSLLMGLLQSYQNSSTAQEVEEPIQLTVEEGETAITYGY